MEKKEYTKEFRAGAAKMVIEQGMKAAQVARDLGVAPSSVSTWVRDFKKHGDGAFPGKGFLAPEDQKIKDLEKRLKRAEMERDLLKKRSRSLRNSTGKI